MSGHRPGNFTLGVAGYAAEVHGFQGARFEVRSAFASIKRLLPSTGPMLGGTAVHILVSGYVRDIKFCFFGEMAVHAQALNASAVACVSPDASREGTVHLRLARTRQQPPQRMREHDVLFEYAAEPRLLGVHPTSGAACGG